MTIWDHLLELRALLIKGLALFLFSCTFSYLLMDSFLPHLLPAGEGDFESSISKEIHLENLQKVPLLYKLKKDEKLIEAENSSFTTNSTIEVNPGGSIKIRRLEKTPYLYQLSPLEGLFSSIRLSLWIGAALSSPFWLYWVLQFALPALNRKEKRILFPLFFSTLASALFALIVTLYAVRPHLLQLLSSSLDSFAPPLWSLGSYIDLLLYLLFASFTLFEIGVLLFLLVHFKILPAELLKKGRRLSWLFAFVLGALLTPPDILSQLVVALPLILFYELAILYGSRRASDVDEIISPTLV